MAMIHTPKKFPPGKGQILYAKSKIYLHLTTSKKDNVPGYLTIVKPFPDSKNNDLIIAFIPESDLSAEDRESLDYFDLYGLDGEKFDFYSSNSSDIGTINGTNFPKINRFVDRPRLSSISSYAFGVSIQQLFSIQVRPKTTNLWEGSIILHPKQEGDRLPALFFHDNESPGTKREQKIKSKNFDPYSENQIGGNSLYWGGDRFVSCLRNYATLRESTLEPGMFLINCTQEDAMNFVPNILDTKDDASNYDLNAEIGQALTTAKWTVLTGLASITGFAKKKLNSAIESNMLPKSLQQFIDRPELKKITDDFDSANVYLAKWALNVQEEAEKNRKMIIGNDYYKELIRVELGDSFVELTPLEVSKATRRSKIDKKKWDSFFDSAGYLQFTVDEVLEQIFHSGLEMNVRKEAWPFLLGVYPWDTTSEERVQLKKTLEDSYYEYKNNWMADLERQQNGEYWKDQKARIYKDLKRTDRDVDFYANNENAISAADRSEIDILDTGKHVKNVNDNVNDNGENGGNNDNNEANTATESSVTRDSGDNNDDDDDDDDDNDYEDDNKNLFNNPNLVVLRDILFSYNEINKNLGYVQGMSDLLSPIYYIFEDEPMAFWAFCRFMDRMERNFVRDLSGMKTQMLTLTELVQFMLPDLYVHLEKCDSSNLFFFFRMLLVWFKREVTFWETMDLWEIMWTDYYSSQFILFFALAILQKNGKIIIQTLKGFDGILRYINDLSGKLDINDLLTRSELLFLKFKQMVELIDRSNDRVGFHAVADRNDQRKKPQPITISKELRGLLSREIVVQKEESRTSETPFG